MLYNVPSRTGITVGSATIVKLSKDVPSITMFVITSYSIHYTKLYDTHLLMSGG